MNNLNQIIIEGIVTDNPFCTGDYTNCNIAVDTRDYTKDVKEQIGFFRVCGMSRLFENVKKDSFIRTVGHLRKEGGEVVIIADYIEVKRTAFKGENKMGKDLIGKTIKIICMKGEPDYTGKTGTVKQVDSLGQLFGTWGGLAVQPENDDFEVISEE